MCLGSCVLVACCRRRLFDACVVVLRRLLGALGARWLGSFDGRHVERVSCPGERWVCFAALSVCRFEMRWSSHRLI